jgi:MFS family permease
LPTASPPAWIGPLVMTLLVQSVSSFLQRMPPTIAPALMDAHGLQPQMIGYFSASNICGSIAFLVMGAPLLRRYGSVRSLQIGLCLGAFGALVFMLPLTPLLVMGTVLMGLGYGPSTPAGSDILQRHAPARHRVLIFSIKQAGVPAGGILAGLVLPQLIEIGGLDLCLLACCLFPLVTALLITPYRRLDPPQDNTQAIDFASFLSLDNLKKPFAALTTHPDLLKLALSGTCLAVGQGVWIAFLVTLLVRLLGMSLTTAGLYFSIMQVTGVFGRILLGFIADRLGSGRTTLRLNAVFSVLTTIALMFLSPDWPLWAVALLCGCAGVTVTSWNGVQIAEIARLAPLEHLREASSGATLILFCGYIIGPVGFALTMALTGGIMTGLIGTCVLISLSLLLMPKEKSL